MEVLFGLDFTFFGFLMSESTDRKSVPTPNVVPMMSNIQRTN